MVFYFCIFVYYLFIICFFLGETCLHKAARLDDLEICKLFIENGAKKTIKGLCGTPYELLKNKDGPMAQILSVKPKINIQHDLRISFKEKKISDFM